MKARVPLAAALTLAALALGPGCKGDPGPAGPAGDAGPAGNPAVTLITVPSNSETPTDAASAAWAALAPKVTIQSVTISSPPVVKFTVTDASGVPIAGLGNTSKSSTATVAGYTNLAFSLAKLVPGVSNAPSKWVSYIVTSVPTTTAPAAPSRPTSDNTGTLVDNGDGTYAYTFYRDVTQIKAQVAGMTVSPPNDTADLGELTYDSSLVHRLTIQLSGNAPGTGTNTPTGVQNVVGVAMTHPVDAIYDFKPGAAGQPGTAVTDSGRDIVATAKCNECHRQLGGIPGDDPESSAAGFHGGNRNETRYCVVCHTDQRKYGRTAATYNASTLTITSSNSYRFGAFGGAATLDRAVGNFPNQIHHIHAGPVLAYKGYNYAGVLFNEVLFPQDLRNCTKCHDGSDTSTAKTPEGDNWKNVPSRLACGGCHDGIDFGTGHGVTLADAALGKTETITFNGFAHGGFQQPDDQNCKQCHSPLRVDIDTAHIPVTPPNPQNALVVDPPPAGTGNANTNAAWIASNPARLPAGAFKVSYEIKSVSVNGSRQAVVVFRLLQNGVRKDLNDFATTTPNPKTGQKEIWPDFMGAPSLFCVFAVPQDGINQPADFNATASVWLKNIWKSPSSGGTLSAPDADGFYTGTLTGATIPTSAVMLTCGIGYTYNVTSTLPLTQTNLEKYPVTPATAPTQAGKFKGGLIVIAPNVQKVATGFTGRRPIVEDKRCNACHQELGTFTEDSFHAGQRNDGTTCSWCHTPNRASSGWSADSTSFIHAIHASAHRDKKFTWHASSTTESFADVKFPGILGACETCHIPGAWDFSSDTSQAALPNRLYRTVATGAFNGSTTGTITSYGPAPNCSTTSQVGPATAVQVFSLPHEDDGSILYITPATPGTSTPWYGIGFAFNGTGSTTNTCDQTTTVANPPGGTIQASDTTLVNSPVATQCFSCHDADDAQAHMLLNGGSIYAPRSTALGTTETCLICHGPGRIAAINVVHNPQQ